MSLGLIAALAIAALALVFAAVFIVARRLDNYGIVDVAWSYAFSLTALIYAVAATGVLTRRVVLAGMVVGWSLRLGTHLYLRVMSHHPVEDGRYIQLRRDWQENFTAKMFGFFQLQALSVVVLSVPFLLAMYNPSPTFSPLEIAGLTVWLVALLGEATADAQLNRFKRAPENRGKVCAVGLWRYSRHPNYFFEWMIWVGYALIALAAPLGWLGLISPAIILHLLLRVTGIPLTEQQSVRSKGDAYRAYQRSTSAFVPWFPRHSP